MLVAVAALVGGSALSPSSPLLLPMGRPWAWGCSASLPSLPLGVGVAGRLAGLGLTLV